MFGYDTDRETVGRIGTTGKVLHEEVPVRHMVGYAGQESVERLRCERTIHRPPPHHVSRDGIAYHELVLGRAASMVPGIHQYGTSRAKPTLTPSDHFLYQPCGGKVPGDGTRRVHPNGSKQVMRPAPLTRP